MRTYEIMRINECVVEHKTVNRVNKLLYRSSFLSFCLFYCIVRCFVIIRILFYRWIDSKEDHHHVARMKFKYDVMRAYAQECKGRTDTVSCG